MTDDLYLVKDNVSVNLSPAGRIENTLTNDLYTRERGVSIRRRTRTKEDERVSIAAGVGTVTTNYRILNVTGVFDNSAGTGTNYWTGGSFKFKTITLGSIGTLIDGQTVYIDYTVASGDTIIVDAGKVREVYLITGNLVSDANGSFETKRSDLKEIFLAGQGADFTFPSTNNSTNVFPTRLTVVQNGGEVHQGEVTIEAVFGFQKS